MTTSPARPDLAAVADLPHWSPRADELDDVELALALDTTDDAPTPTVTVVVPADSPAARGVGEGLLLTDPEGTPLAHLEVSAVADAPAPPAAPVVEVIGTGSAGGGVGPSVLLTGHVSALQPAEHGPFRRLRRTAAEVRADLGSSGALGVPLDQPLQHAHLHAVRARADGRPVFLLPLVGAGNPRLVSAGALVRTALLAAAALGDATVVPLPYARRAGGSGPGDRPTPAEVARAYGATDVLDLDEVDDAHPVDRVDELLVTGASLAETYPDDVAAVVAGAFRPAHARGLTVFFTGLSGSGKSTVARALAERLEDEGRRTLTLLDGDVVRRMLSAGLTFSKADRETNIRRIGFVAAEIARHGGLAICCPIAPYASTRADVRAMVTAAGGTFVLVHVSTPVEECERRDRKGFYAKARAGVIGEFTGISDPYEVPSDADLAIDTTDVGVDDAVQRVVDLLETRGLLAPGAALVRRAD